MVTIYHNILIWLFIIVFSLLSPSLLIFFLSYSCYTSASSAFVHDMCVVYLCVLCCTCHDKYMFINCLMCNWMESKQLNFKYPIMCTPYGYNTRMHSYRTVRKGTHSFVEEHYIHSSTKYIFIIVYLYSLCVSQNEHLCMNAYMNSSWLLRCRAHATHFAQHKYFIDCAQFCEARVFFHTTSRAAIICQLS